MVAVSRAADKVRGSWEPTTPDGESSTPDWEQSRLTQKTFLSLREFYIPSLQMALLYRIHILRPCWTSESCPTLVLPIGELGSSSLSSGVCSDLVFSLKLSLVCLIPQSQGKASKAMACPLRQVWSWQALPRPEYTQVEFARP